MSEPTDRTSVYDRARQVGARAGVQTGLMIALSALGLALHWGTLDNALLGADTFPLIVTSRIESASDFLGTFREVMMDGRYAAGDFYRPTQNLVLALDWQVWALDPRGYQATTLALYAASISLVYALCRRCIGANTWLGPSIGALFFLLHRSLLGVMGIPSRRPELLFVACALAALVVLPVRSNGNAPAAQKRNVRIRWIVAAGFAVLAAGAKEAGAIVLGLVFAHQWLFNGEGRVRERSIRALWATAPTLVGIGLLSLNRLVVLGGLGGYRQTDGVGVFATAVRVISDLSTALFLPHRLRDDGPALLIPIAVWLALISFSAIAVRRRRAGGSHDPKTGLDGDRILASLALGITWILGLVAIYSFATQYALRYTIACLPAVGLILAALVEEAVERLRNREGSIAAPALQIAALGAIVAIALSNTPANRDYAARDQATRVQTQLLADLAGSIERGREGDRIEVDLVPPLTEPMLRRHPEMREGAPPPPELVQSWLDSLLREKRTAFTGILPRRSYQAWSELAFPTRRVRIELGPTGFGAAPESGELVVVLWLRPERARL